MTRRKANEPVRCQNATPVVHTQLVNGRATAAVGKWEKRRFNVDGGFSRVASRRQLQQARIRLKTGSLPRGRTMH
jgi:hypothetical protein